MQSLAHQFLDFCRAKPAGEEFNAYDSTNCAVFQFLRDSGYPVWFVGVGTWYAEAADGPVTHRLPEPVKCAIIAAHELARDHPEHMVTWGALADRLSATLNREGAER